MHHYPDYHQFLQHNPDTVSAPIDPVGMSDTHHHGEWTPTVGEKEMYKHYELWRPAVVTKVPNNHPDSRERKSYWEVRLESGAEVYILQLNELRRLTE